MIGHTIVVIKYPLVPSTGWYCWMDAGTRQSLGCHTVSSTVSTPSFIYFLLKMSTVVWWHGRRSKSQNPMENLLSAALYMSKPLPILTTHPVSNLKNKICNLYFGDYKHWQWMTLLQNPKGVLNQDNHNFNSTSWLIIEKMELYFSVTKILPLQRFLTWDPAVMEAERLTQYWWKL